MGHLGENTAVLPALRFLNHFISQRAEKGSGLDTSTLPRVFCRCSTIGERSLRRKEPSRAYLIQVEREKMQMDLSHKRAGVQLEKADRFSARNYEREADRNPELLAGTGQLQGWEAEAEEKMRSSRTAWPRPARRLAP
ncbi:Mitotic spindle assembly checkpoint protein MAD1 [Fukomys damarensis]|uniref:Mitotic spindle assembly checkpoint protein MAD1 n=1 Tax=Fukomys damarensis TaxID=885580 RepID=A0A091D0X6_FUKDA|nr:Mitotic spindle assembly checkpoint protein MAD1 [Fukomys damarensis]